MTATVSDFQMLCPLGRSQLCSSAISDMFVELLLSSMVQVSWRGTTRVSCLLGCEVKTLEKAEGTFVLFMSQDTSWRQEWR